MFISFVLSETFTFHYELIITKYDRFARNKEDRFTFHYELIITKVLVIAPLRVADLHFTMN